MAVNLVSCSRCGRVFDSVAEHCLHDRNTNTYICSNCLGHTAASGSRSVFTPASSPSAPAKKPRSKTGTYLRVIFGILFICTGFSCIDDGDDTWITCFVLGIVLLVWQFWPQIVHLFRKKQTEIQAQRQAEALEAREAARYKICSHCGATVAGTVCEYCGMPLDVQ